VKIRKVTILILGIILLSSLFPLGGGLYADVTFSATELLGRPTDTSVTVNVVPNSSGQIYFEYGTESGVYTDQTSTDVLTSGVPYEVVISGLTPNTKYYYRMVSSSDGITWVNGTEHSFYTQRSPGSTFTFTITADSHVNIMLGNATTWTQTMNNVADDNPDFLIDLGDTFAMDSVTTQSGADSAYFYQRQFFDLVGHSAPIFLVAGNHEQTEGWHLDDTGNPATGPPVLATNAQKKYYINPVPDSFYSGNTDTYPYLSEDQYRENYYAWEWGDALFVVIDPYWYTTSKPYTGGGGGGEGSDVGTGDRWDWTLGLQQFNWLKETLEDSSAPYKLIFAHHMVGGSEDYVRGGANPAHLVEWGGYDENGTDWGWDSERSGWGSDTIRQVLIDNNVSAFFHGHDHQYAYEMRDGIVYQCLPAAGFSGNGFNIYSTGSGYTIQALPSPGHLRVTVSPSLTTVYYIGTSGGTMNYSYDILPSSVNEAPEVTDIPDQTVNEGETFATINLDDYVSDPDNTDAEMTWTYSGNTELSVSIDGSRVATIGIPGAEWTGAETITFRATDPGALWDEDGATFTVLASPSVISGITAEVKGDVIPGATVKLYLDGALQSTTTSNTNGQYELIATEIDEYTVVVSAAGFKKETQTISIVSLDDDYTLDFIGNHGLIPQAPSLSYVLNCANHWLFPPAGHPELALSMSKVLAVANAYLYH
jgi:hypothetical protein